MTQIHIDLVVNQGICERGCRIRLLRLILRLVLSNSIPLSGRSFLRQHDRWLLSLLWDELGYVSVGLLTVNVVHFIYCKEG